MKKLLYSTLSIVLIASTILVGCKKDDDGTGGDDGTKPTPKGPNIAFQTNTGTFTNFTFAPTNDVPVSTVQAPTVIKIGVIITSDIDLKSTKMTVKFENQPETSIGLDTLVSTKTCNRTYSYVLPVDDKGTYTFTAYATDKDATTSKAVIKVTAYGPLAEIGPGKFYSLLATDIDHLSAFDLLNGIAVTAAGTANLADRYMVDMSTGSTLSGSWKSQNGAEFVISGADGKLNGKTYSQLKSEADVIAAWNVSNPKATTISGITDLSLIIVKHTINGVAKYYVIGMNEVHDDPGSENDYYDFHYQQ